MVRTTPILDPYPLPPESQAKLVQAGLTLVHLNIEDWTIMRLIPNEAAKERRWFSNAMEARRWANQRYIPKQDHIIAERSWAMSQSMQERILSNGFRLVTKHISNHWYELKADPYRWIRLPERFNPNREKIIEC